MSYGSSGNGSAVHLSTELLKAMTQTSMVHIPYRGAAPALTDLMGGHIQLFLDAAVGLIGPGKAGTVRLIGVASETRLAALPDVPTFIEQGIKGFTGSTWAGILAPAGTPPAVIKRIADEVAAIVKLPDVKQSLMRWAVPVAAHQPNSTCSSAADRQVGQRDSRGEDHSRMKSPEPNLRIPVLPLLTVLR